MTFYTPSELAVELRYKVRKIYELIADGSIGAVKVSRKHLLIPADEVRELVDRNMQGRVE